MNTMIASGEALPLNSLVTPTPGGIASRILARTSGGNLTLFARQTLIRFLWFDDNRCSWLGDETLEEMAEGPVDGCATYSSKTASMFAGELAMARPLVML